MIPFSKVQSIGNDFVLVALDAFPSDAQLVEFVKASCARRFGVGSDGLLALGRSPEGLVLRMFNPDGTEDFCGNGLRCAAHYATLHGWVGEEFTIRHLGRKVKTSVKDGVVSTELGAASFKAADIPLNEAVSASLVSRPEIPLAVAGETLSVIPLSTGTAHTVIFVDELPGDEKFFALSPHIEVHPLFPERTSVMWTRVAGERKLRLRIWERGVGETLGCGSGSCAAGAAYFRRTGLSGDVEVQNPGGTVTVSMGDWRAPITISGRAEVVYSGVWG